MPNALYQCIFQVELSQDIDDDGGVGICIMTPHQYCM